MELLKTYTQDMPASRFIGKKYTEADRVNGSFGMKWGEAFAAGFFDSIEAAEKNRDFFEDSDSYIGLMLCRSDDFEYWIGKFTEPGTEPPEGFAYIDFTAQRLGVGWLYGMENDLYCHEDVVMKSLAEIGVKPKEFGDWSLWCFERYQCPRFTEPDEKGCVILDICFIVE